MAGARRTRSSKKTASVGTRGKKAAAKKTTAKKSGAKKTAAKKSGAKKTAARKTAAKKTAAKKTAAKKTAAKKTAAKKTSAKKTAAKKTAAKKTAAKKTAAKKTAAKKTTAAKKSAARTASDRATVTRAAPKASPSKRDAAAAAKKTPSAEELGAANQTASEAGERAITAGRAPAAADAPRLELVEHDDGEVFDLDPFVPPPESAGIAAAGAAEPAVPKPPPLPEPRLASTCSQGGPVLAIPAELAAVWRGTLPPLGVEVPPGWKWGDRGGPICDYDRICEWSIYAMRTDYGGIGLIPVGDGTAIALDAEIVTSWLPLPDGGAIIRTGSSIGASEGMALLDRAAQAGFQPLAATITLLDGRIFLFDSAYAGAADPSEIRAFDGVAIGSPGPGVYSVDATTIDGTDVIRLSRT